MDYAGHYRRLIDRALGREFVGYSERHHIVPRCLGGADEPANIVRLSAEEHFVAHQLLVKMHPSHFGLIWALSAMAQGCRNTPRNNKRYGWLRRKFGNAMRERFAGKPLSAEHRAKLSEAARKRQRRPHSAEARKKMSERRTGIKFTAEHRAKLAAAKLGVKRGPYGPRKRTEA